MKDDTAICHVEPNYMTDEIWVLIPPKYWDKPNLSECIKKAIEATVKIDETQRS